MVDESKLDAYIEIAKILSGQSKCSMHKVAAIIINTRTLNIVSIGYNGTPSGYVNCNKLFKKISDEVLYISAHQPYSRFYSEQYQNQHN